MSISLVQRLRFDATRCEATFSKGVASNIEEAADKIEQMHAALLICQDYLDLSLGSPAYEGPSPYAAIQSALKDRP